MSIHLPSKRQLKLADEKKPKKHLCFSITRQTISVISGIPTGDAKNKFEDLGFPGIGDKFESMLNKFQDKIKDKNEDQKHANHSRKADAEYGQKDSTDPGILKSANLFKSISSLIKSKKEVPDLPW